MAFISSEIMVPFVFVQNRPYRLARELQNINVEWGDSIMNVNLIDDLRRLIGAEDPKKPLTDEEIAQQLQIRREEVTNMRNRLDIPDSRKRFKPTLLKAISKLFSAHGELSERRLTRELQLQGFDVSRHVVGKMMRELKYERRIDHYSENRLNKGGDGNQQSPKNRQSISNEEEDGSRPARDKAAYQAFEEIIGADGSLKPYIQQAQAAVLYPPNGLHTLLLGATGVGKSQLAEAMYFFAIESKRLKQDAPFVVFNCADYAENPQLLMAQLFGSVKGAFTGADRDRQGLIEQADGGILFLDEVHRLPPEGQELLFYIIDKGKFRRLGETAPHRTATLMIICATTENVESSLLITFRRRIPMAIELPSLDERPLSERHKIILQCFHKEANRTGVVVRVQSDVLRALLAYDCPGNIGQLRSDVQVACARAFLRYVGSQNKEMMVEKGDLPEHAKREFSHKKSGNLELEQLSGWDITLSPNQENYHITLYENLYSLPDEIYKYIENRYLELSRQGGSKEAINRIIGLELEYRFDKMMRRLEEHTRPMERKDLLKIVGVDVVEAVEKMVWIAEQQLNKSFERLYYSLAIHVHATLERIKQGKPVINPHLDRVKEDHAIEFKVAQEMADVINHCFQVVLPEDEIGFITMYLRTVNGSGTDGCRVGIVVISHGKVAGGMAEVANRLLGVNHARAVEMSLDEGPEVAYERTLSVVRDADEGKGVLLLVDMGSLVQFGDRIMKETGIPVKTIHGTNTVLVIESVRKAMLPDNTLDELVDSLDQDITFSIVKAPGDDGYFEKKRAILTICISGHGAAVKLKELLLERLPQLDDQVEIIPVSAIVKNDHHTVYEYMKQYRMIAAVGTVDPHTPAVPFISIDDLTSGRGIPFIKRLLKWSLIDQSPQGKKGGEAGSNPVSVRKETKPSLADVLDEQLIFTEGSFTNKQDILHFLFEKLYIRGYVSEDYYGRMMEREQIGSTLFPQDAEAAIPHADPTSVHRPVIAVLLLERPIVWDFGCEVKYVFMLALKENCGDAIQQLYEAVRQESVKKRLSTSQNGRQVIDILTEKKERSIGGR